jgi:hypothetical protein
MSKRHFSKGSGKKQGKRNNGTHQNEDWLKWKNPTLT